MRVHDNKSTVTVTFTLTLLFIFAPWVYLQSFIRIPADAAWLISAAEHILNGQALSEYYFDTNPPLCFIIFIPVIGLMKAGLEIWQALHVYTLGLSILSLGISAYFLRLWPIPNAFKHTLLLFYGIALLCVPLLEYGQKDHLIAITLLPFLLAQLSITYKHQKSSLPAILTFIAFTPFILTKPHYGLLPTAVLLHRLYRQRSLKIVFDPDFIILAIGTLSYIAATIIFFPDFINLVLPLSLELYVGALGDPVIHKFAIAMLFIWACMMGMALASENTGEQKTLSVFIVLFAGLAVIPYWVQWKGFSLHLIPFSILFVTSTGALAGLYYQDFIQRHARYLLFVMAVISFAGVTIIWQNKADISHNYYRTHDLTDILKPKGPEKSFYIESNSTTTALQMAVYLDMEFASRFVANWFTYHLVELEGEQRDTYWQLLGDYFAQDMERYKPETLLFVNSPDHYTILNTFAEHENFQNALSAYERERIYTTDDIFMASEEILGMADVPYYVYKRQEYQPSEE
ncbi:MAG: hypothetical protein ACLFR0_00250 [Alphaproteobacteria bacterium]